jgi:cytochrome P450
LLRNQDKLELPSDVVLRETCFYLLAGAHTSATAFVRTLHNVFTYTAAHPDVRDDARKSLAFLQRCTHETIRLQPSSPVALRWALADIELADGTQIRAGDRVEIDLNAANREAGVFGEAPNEFNPNRELPAGIWRWGLSFGLGMHACIGQDLAAGMDALGGVDVDDHLYGLVPVAVHAVIAAQGRPDPAHPAQLDPNNTRGYWGTYPVMFES